MSRSTARLLLFAAGCLFFAAPTFAQVTTATLLGIVRDPSGSIYATVRVEPTTDVPVQISIWRRMDGRTWDLASGLRGLSTATVRRSCAAPVGPKTLRILSARCTTSRRARHGFHRGHRRRWQWHDVA